MQAETPANFISHPVADAGAGILIEEEGFEGFLGVASNEILDSSEGEL